MKEMKWKQGKEQRKKVNVFVIKIKSLTKQQDWCGETDGQVHLGTHSNIMNSY